MIVAFRKYSSRSVAMFSSKTGQLFSAGSLFLPTGLQPLEVELKRFPTPFVGRDPLVHVRQEILY